MFLNDTLLQTVLYQSLKRRLKVRPSSTIVFSKAAFFLPVYEFLIHSGFVSCHFFQLSLECTELVFCRNIFSLNCHRLNEIHIPSFFRCSRFTYVDLYLRSNDFYCVDWQTVSFSLHNIVSLNIEDVSDYSFLSPSLCPNVKHIMWRSIDKAGLSSFSDALPTAASLTSLDFLGCNLGSNGGQQLCSALSNRNSVSHLSLSGCSISDLGIVNIINNRLVHLDVSYNSISDAGAHHLADSLKKNSSLKALVLRCNQITATGGRSLAGALKLNDSLSSLDLRYNRLGSLGTEFIADSLSVNTGLSMLDLWGNDIGSEGICHLARGLRDNCSLKELGISENNIGSSGAKFLAELLAFNQGLVVLDCWWNGIDETGMESILSSLKNNSHSSLMKINVYGNDFSYEFKHNCLSSILDFQRN
ncbi:hypothetical protein GEMRC1_006294 [Eukaryota sp. GEM-RC1]